MSRSKLTVITCLLLLSLPFAAAAETSVRSCIRFAGQTVQWVIPAKSVVDIMDHDFKIGSTSNLIVLGTLFYQDHSQPTLQNARYDILIDGGSVFRQLPWTDYFDQLPRETDGSSVFRVMFENIPAGLHTLTLRLDNRNPSDIHLTGAWMDSLFVDPVENDMVGQRRNWVTLSPSQWTTIGQVTTPSFLDRRLILSSYVVASGTDQPIQYRYVAGGQTILETFVVNYRNATDGTTLNTIWKDAVGGTAITLQALGSGSVVLSELQAQSIQKYTVMEAKLGSQMTFSNGGTRVVLSTSTPEQWNSLSTGAPPGSPGQFKVQNWGFGYTETSMSVSREQSVYQKIFDEGQPIDGFQDIGVTNHSPVPARSHYPQATGGNADTGFFGNHKYNIEHSIEGLCTKESSNITVYRSKIQLLGVPKPGPHACSANDGAANCDFKCNVEPTLTTVTRPPRNRCN